MILTAVLGVMYFDDQYTMIIGYQFMILPAVSDLLYFDKFIIFTAVCNALYFDQY